MVTDLATEVWEVLQALPTWQGFLLVVGCSLVLAVLVQVGGDALIRRLTRTIPGDVDKVIFRSIHPPLYVTVVLAGVFVAVRLLEVATDWTGLLESGLLTLLTLMWMYALVGMGRRVSNEATEDDRFDNQVVPIFQNVWTAVVLGGGVYLVLTYWNVDVTPLLASAGVLGIVLGLAARDTIANFFGSIALYADRTYAIGDFVVLESGERGRVEDISIRSTDIRTRDDTVVTVPNSQLNTATIVNESTPERERRLRVSLGVAYGSDLDYVEEVLLDVAREERFVIDEPRPRVRYRGFGDSAVELDVLCWIPSPRMRERVKHRLVKATHDQFETENIEVPFPQRDVTVTDGDGDQGEEADPGAGEPGNEDAALDEGPTDAGRTDASDGRWVDETADHADDSGTADPDVVSGAGDATEK